MKARSRKFLGAAVAVAAMAAYAAPAVHAQSIIFEFGAPTGSINSTSGGSVSFPVLALVTGTDLANTGLVSAQFSLIQTPGTLTNGVLSFSLSSAYDETGTHGTNSFVFGSTPAASTPGGNLGGGTLATGSSNDTIIGITGINNSAGDSTVNKTAPAPTGGTQVVGGSTYNVFNLGTGTLTVSGAASGSTSISIAPRGGLGNLIKPQVAIINSTLAQFRGDDAAVTEGTPLSITAAPNTLPGDITGPGGGGPDGVVDQNDLNVILQNFGHTGSVFATGDISGPSGSPDGQVDQNDLNVVLQNFGHTGGGGSGEISAPSLAAVLSAVPEPTSAGILLVGSAMMLKRRRRA